VRELKSSKFQPCRRTSTVIGVSAFYGRLEGVTDSISFCDCLLDTQRIAAIPGKAFGRDACLRFSFVADQASIAEGLKRLATM